MGGDVEPPFELKGISKYFNSYTQKGRINTVTLSFGIAIAGILWATSGKKKAPPAEASSSTS